MRRRTGTSVPPFFALSVRTSRPIACANGAFPLPKFAKGKVPTPTWPRAGGAFFFFGLAFTVPTDRAGERGGSPPCLPRMR